MAFPTVPTQAGGRIAFVNQLNTTATLTGPNLNTLTKSPGDLLIAIAGEYQSNAGTNAAYTGWAGGGLTWTEIADSTGTAAGRLGIAIARVVTGSETGTVTVTRSGTLVGDASMVVLVIPGAHAVTNPEVTAMATGTTTAADPASLSPSWGAEDTLWIAVCGNGMTSATGSWTGTTAAPTNYTDFLDTAAADTSTIGDFDLSVAFRQLNAASEDAGPFTTDISNARSSALVIAVRPVAPVADTPATQIDSDTIGYSATSETTSPSSFKTLNVLAGDLITVGVNTEDNNKAETVSKASGTATLSTLTRTAGTNTASNSRVSYWTADVTADGTLVIQVSIANAPGYWGANIRQFRDHGGVGASFAGLVQSNNLAKQGAHSKILANVSSWAATDPTGATFNGGLSLVSLGRDTGGLHYSWVRAELLDAGAAGTVNYGVATPTLGTPAIAMLEVLGIVGSGTTPVSSDLDLRYRITQQVSSDLDLRYRITQQVSSDLDLRYSIKSTVTSDLDLRYAILTTSTSSVSSDLDLRYAIRSTVSSDLDLRYRVAARVFTDLDLRYAIRAAVSSDVSLLYAIRSTVTSDVDLRYRIAQRITSDLDVRYALRVIINSDLDLRYAIRNTVNSDLDIRYVILSSLLNVFSDLDLRYRVFQRINSDFDLRYAIRNTINSDLDLRYRILQSLVSNLDLRYRIAQQLTSDLNLQYRIAQRLSSDLDLRYGIASTVTSSLDLRYVVKGLVNSDLDIRYNILSPLTVVSSTLDLRYIIKGLVTSDLDLRYRLAGKISSDLDLRYGIRSTLTSDLDLRYAILSRLSSDIDLRFRIFQLVNSDSDLRWRVRQGVSSDLDLQYRVIARVVSELDLKWRIGKGTRIKWWDGTQWVEANNIKVWNGTAWQPAIWKMWDGVDWL